MRGGIKREIIMWIEVIEVINQILYFEASDR